MLVNANRYQSVRCPGRTGEIELCNAKYGASGSGRFDATLCPGGLPIFN